MRTHRGVTTDRWRRTWCVAEVAARGQKFTLVGSIAIAAGAMTLVEMKHAEKTPMHSMYL